MNGSVFLIGAGPGDPGLLTMRGAELLRGSDIVLYDGLCNPEILAQSPQATHICVGKHGQSRIWKQDEIIKEMIRYAKEGKNVSRLKGGDPAVFARTAEEVDALAKEGIKFEIVPGITAALAAGSFAGIPVTHRQLASAVALVTGHEEPDKSASSLDWEALARFPGTLVIYMGVTTADLWTRNLIQGGLSPQTSVAIVRRCSLPDQQVFRCKLEEIPKLLGVGMKTRPPVIVVIGKVSELHAHDFQQFANHRPLSGQTVLVTRPVEQAEPLVAELRKLGAHVIIQPMIRISSLPNFDEIDRAIDHRGEWNYIIFCSQNGVRHFMERLFEKKLDSRSLAGIKIGVVGSKTEQALKQYGIQSDIVPTDFNGDQLAGIIASEANGKKVLIIRASRGNQRISEILTEAGSQVTQIASYSHEDVTEVDDTILEKMASGEIDWVTAMSSETLRNLYRCFGDSLRDCKLATISPITSQVAKELGLSVSAEASPYTSQGLIQSILKTKP